MFEGGNSYQNDLYANIPVMAQMFAMISPVFGNGSFVVQPASPGEVQAGFPSIPYTPLEAYIYQQQSSNPSVSPVNITSGSNTGQQVINGSQTISDSTGTSRMLNGTQVQH